MRGFLLLLKIKAFPALKRRAWKKKEPGKKKKGPVPHFPEQGPEEECQMHKEALHLQGLSRTRGAK